MFLQTAISSAKISACCAALVFAQGLNAQTQSASSGPGTTSSKASAVAASAEAAPTIDGSDRDGVWRAAMAVDDFRVYDPTVNGTPSMRTEARFAYDARNLYVFVRAFDPRPD